jgi:hypothetical protein
MRVSRPLCRTFTHKSSQECSLCCQTAYRTEKANMSELFNAALEQLSNLKLVSGGRQLYSRE